jgi:hypothetical protein
VDNPSLVFANSHCGNATKALRSAIKPISLGRRDTIYAPRQMILRLAHLFDCLFETGAQPSCDIVSLNNE